MVLGSAPIAFPKTFFSPPPIDPHPPSGVEEVLRTYFSEEKIHLDYLASNLQALN